MFPPLPTGVPSRAHEIIATTIACSVLSVCFIILRFGTRIYISRAVGWDDYVAGLTLPFVITYSVLVAINTRYGMGLHEKDMPPGLEIEYFRWIDIGSPFYILSLFGYKISIILVYLRIYKINKRFRLATYITAFLIFGYLFCNFWTQLFGCHPFAKEYNKKLPGKCINYNKADYVYGSFNVGTDMMLFILPLPMIWKLTLSTREKVGVALLFMVGSLNWAVACVRFALAVKDLTSEDRIWLAGETFLWSVIEVNTGLILCCLPALKPFFKRVVPKTLTDKASKTKESKSWSFGKGQVSWTGDRTLLGDEEEGGLGPERHKKWVSVGPNYDLNKKIQYADQAFSTTTRGTDSNDVSPSPPPLPIKDPATHKLGSQSSGSTAVGR